MLDAEIISKLKNIQMIEGQTYNLYREIINIVEQHDEINANILKDLSYNIKMNYDLLDCVIDNIQSKTED